MSKQTFFDFNDESSQSPPVPPGVPSIREQHLEQIRRDMAVLAGPSHYYEGDEEFYRNRIEMHRQVIKAMDAESQSPASI